MSSEKSNLYFSAIQDKYKKALEKLSSIVDKTNDPALKTIGRNFHQSQWDISGFRGTRYATSDPLPPSPT